MSQLTKQTKTEIISELIDTIVIQHDIVSNSYYIGIPSNVILHSGGTIIFKSSSMILDAPSGLHFNPPKTFLESIQEKFKPLINLIWRKNGN